MMTYEEEALRTTRQYERNVRSGIIATVAFSLLALAGLAETMHANKKQEQDVFLFSRQLTLKEDEVDQPEDTIKLLCDELVCKDNAFNKCVSDFCSEESGCGTEDVVCDNNIDDMCVNDLCDAEIGCITEELDCDDGISCTDDSCNSSTGCVIVPNSDNCPGPLSVCAPDADDANPVTGCRDLVR